LVAGGISREFSDHKFLKDIRGGRFADPDSSVLEYQPRPTIGSRKVKIRNSACGKAAQDT
jgi:hypothetical protein